MSEICGYCGVSFSARGIRNHAEACRKQHENGLEQETHDTRVVSVNGASSAADNQEDRNEVVDRLSGTEKPDKTPDPPSDNKESGSRLWTWAVGIGSGLAILAGFAFGGKVK